MSSSPNTNNRLKKALDSVAIPPELPANIRMQIRADQAADEANSRLRAAVHSVSAPPFLEARIRSQTMAQTPGRRWIPRLVPAAAGLALIAGLSIAYQLGRLRFTAGTQESYIVSVSTQVATLMRVGLGDHIHCSVFRKYPKNPPATEQFVEKLTPQYAGLLPIVRQEVPDTYRLTLAHQCSYHQRTFIHLSLRNDSNTLSLVLTRKGSGESFQTEDMPALMQADVPMYEANVRRFQITAFETRDYLVYFISDLPQNQNTGLMLAIAPKVKDFLKNTEL